MVLPPLEEMRLAVLESGTRRWRRLPNQISFCNRLLSAVSTNIYYVLWEDKFWCKAVQDGCGCAVSLISHRVGKTGIVTVCGFFWFVYFAMCVCVCE